MSLLYNLISSGFPGKVAVFPTCTGKKRCICDQGDAVSKVEACEKHKGVLYQDS